MIQWLGLLTFTVKGLGFLPGQKMRFSQPHGMVQPKVLTKRNQRLKKVFHILVMLVAMFFSFVFNIN